MKTRAVLRMVQPSQSGAEASCAACKERIVWSARKKAVQVICNLYENGVWTDTVHFHGDCYDAAGWPHGQAVA